MARRPDWRTDPGWQLASWDETRFKRPPRDRPLPKAELASPPLWASLYDENQRVIATWFRPVVSVAGPSKSGGKRRGS